MRHGKKFPHLGRKRGHRKYMLANMACSLIEHKSINTTLTKAKALKLFVEPLITKSKNDSTHNRRIVFRYLRNKYAVTELFREISVKVGDRPGGYTRIIKLGNRLGDNASIAMIELVDYNDTYSTTKPDSRKRRRRKKKSSNDNAQNLTTDQKLVSEEAPAAEEVSAVEEAPAAEEVSAVEEAPAAEEVSAVEEAPAAEEVSAVEEAPAAEEVPAQNDGVEKEDSEKKE
ncbi:MAG: 50S ribosomal protein L17 [Cryomorphaceae bacterium MED-G14]|nr:MAG: 50S ribosomal protein L17 [Cryomorphaceae bacterium MED-G14]